MDIGCCSTFLDQSVASYLNLSKIPCLDLSLLAEVTMIQLILVFVCSGRCTCILSVGAHSWARLCCLTSILVSLCV